MSVFEYTAMDRSGKTISRVVTASGRASVLEQIAVEGLHPVSVEERRDRPRIEKKRRFRSTRVSQAAVEGFTRQLANLLTAGVSLSRALELLTREATQAAARAQWSAIHEDVVGGMSLGNALKKWPRSFPPVYVAMVRAGETGGFLELVLNQIADFRSNERDLKSKVKAALVYPIVLAVMATLVLVFLLTYFIPRFSAIFAEFGGALPWLTRVIVALSDVVIGYGFVAVICAALVVLAMQRLMSSDAGRRAVERSLLGLPAVGRIVAHFALVRFCRMLGTLLGAGVRDRGAARGLAGTESGSIEAAVSRCCGGDGGGGRGKRSPRQGTHTRGGRL